MHPEPNYRWKCEECGHELIGNKDLKVQSNSQKCPKCKGEMEGDDLIKTGPFPLQPHKVY